jgi:hypothetical protein
VKKGLVEAHLLHHSKDLAKTGWVAQIEKVIASHKSNAGFSTILPNVLHHDAAPPGDTEMAPHHSQLRTFLSSRIGRGANEWRFALIGFEEIMEGL